MKQLSFAPGPSQLYPGVQQWCQQALESGVASLSHRSSRYSEIHGGTVDQLRQLLDVPTDYEVYFLSSATEAMERIIQNCVKSHSYHLVNGLFAKRFLDTAKDLGKKPEVLSVKYGESFDPHMLRIPKSAELVCATHNETSTGATTPLETIYAIKDKRPDVLVAVDMVSSAPVAGLDLDRVDAAFFSVQKGFGLPAGLAVLIVSPAALAKAAELDNRGFVTGSYHSFRELSASAKKSQTPETPNVLGIYLLGLVARDMNRRGMDALHDETDKKLNILHAAVEAHPSFRHFVAEPKHRSRTVVTVETTSESGRFVRRLEEQGVVVGSGYGSEFKDRHLRIANFPSVDTAQVQRLSELLRGHLL